MNKITKAATAVAALACVYRLVTHSTAGAAITSYSTGMSVMIAALKAGTPPALARHEGLIAALATPGLSDADRAWLAAHWGATE